LPATFPYTGFLDGVAYPVIPLGTSIVNVSSSSALTTALTNATAGQRIILGNGTYSGTFTISKSGTATNGNGISIEAASTGGAVFGSGSQFAISNAAYVTLKGMSFPYELPSGGNIIKFSGSSNHCRLTRCLIGPGSLGTMSTTRTVYVFITDDGELIRLDHNELRNKANYGNPIIWDGNSTTNQACKHIRVDHNYIHDISPEAVDQKEPTQASISAMSKSLSYSAIERNVFANCLAGAEVISAKCSGVRISGNTFLLCEGGPVYLYGTDGVMSDNYVIDNGSSIPGGGTGGGTGGGGTANTYRWYRFAPTALRDATLANSVQLSEFAILSGTTRLTGMAITATNNNSPVGEDPTMAGDNSTSTKWLSLNKTASTLVYDFGSPVAADGYRWATANDSTERDPISWTVDGSQDGTTWTNLDIRTGYATPTLRMTYLPDFGFGGKGGVAPGGGTGGGTGGTTQTLGVGGVATPAGAIVETGNRGAFTISSGGTSGSPKVYDGAGHTSGRITVTADHVVVQNYVINADSQYAAVIDANDVTFQNNDLRNVHAPGDLNAITMWGNDLTVRYNTAVNFITGDPGDSHSDFIQTWVSSSHPVGSARWQITHNKATGPANPSRNNSVPSIHQCVMAEGYNAPGSGNSGGDGVNPHDWYIADNEFGASWNQDIKLNGIENVVITRNNFDGSSDHVIEVDSASSNVTLYSDNQFGSGYGGIGYTVTSGPGPSKPSWL
jgi:hypothetical protein